MAIKQINSKNSDGDEVGKIIDLLAAEMPRRVPEMASINAINRIGELLRSRTRIKRVPH